MSNLARQPDVSRGALWAGLFGGALAWTAHLMLSYAVAEFGCVGRMGARDYQGISMVAWAELALTLLTAMGSAAATLVAYRSDRRLRSDEDTCRTVEQYMARAGLFTSGAFTFIILFESIPILYYLPEC
jgi:hypothetical protein